MLGDQCLEDRPESYGDATICCMLPPCLKNATPPCVTSIPLLPRLAQHKAALARLRKCLTQWLAANAAFEHASNGALWPERLRRSRP